MSYSVAATFQCLCTLCCDWIGMTDVSITSDGSHFSVWEHVKSSHCLPATAMLDAVDASSDPAPPVAALCSSAALSTSLLRLWTAASLLHSVHMMQHSVFLCLTYVI